MLRRACTTPTSEQPHAFGHGTRIWMTTEDRNTCFEECDSISTWCYQGTDACITFFSGAARTETTSMSNRWISILRRNTGNSCPLRTEGSSNFEKDEIMPKNDGENQKSIDGSFYFRLVETLCSFLRLFEYDLTAPILSPTWWKISAHFFEEFDSLYCDSQRME